MSLIRFLIPVVGVLLSVPLAFLALLLIFEAQTVAGRVFGIAVVLLVLGGLTASLSVVNVYRRRRRHLWRLVFFYVVCALLLLAASYGVSPGGAGVQNGRLRSEWTGLVGHQRWAPANLVPEVDQLRLGGWLMPYLDEKITPGEAESLVVALSGLCRELQGDREFQEMGSALDEAYRDMAGVQRAGEGGHLFAYVPEVEEGKKVPVLVFLHGRPGNLKAGIWGWKKAAERRGFAVVAPTAGVGTWEGESGRKAVQRALDYCKTREDIDEERLVMVGLDSGAIGCLEALAEFGDQIGDVAFVSALVGRGGLGGEGVVEGERGRRLLFIHGDNDLRIPLSLLQMEVGELRRKGVQVTLQSFQAGGHGVFWTQNEETVEAIINWLRL
ncbi:MAG: hypothetical protein P8J87_02790 [Verrucomicrobiales bacterium]|nr:hypothetical protein [Verrucomicrobiales bacterium]